MKLYADCFKSAPVGDYSNTSPLTKDFVITASRAETYLTGSE